MMMARWQNTLDTEWSVDKNKNDIWYRWQKRHDNQIIRFHWLLMCLIYLFSSNSAFYCTYLMKMCPFIYIYTLYVYFFQCQRTPQVCIISNKKKYHFNCFIMTSNMRLHFTKRKFTHFFTHLAWHAIWDICHQSQFWVLSTTLK